MADRRTEFRNARRRFDRGQVEIVAPYTFIPLTAPLLSCFGKKEKPSHGRPYADGLCGRLTVVWTFETPVLVGGPDDAGKEKRREKSKAQQESAATDESKAQKPAAEFMTDARGRPIIPGATLRGLLRNVIEIATASRMDIVDRDAHFAVRDSTDTYWRANAAIEADRAMSFGWLVRTDPERGFSERTYDGWSLKIVSEAWQIETTEVLRLITSRPDRLEFESRTVKEKYAALVAGPGARIRFSTIEKPNAGRFEEPRKAIPDPSGKPGWIVFTGVDPNRESGKPKRYATLFGQEVSDTGPLPADIVRRFIKIHATTPGGTSEKGAWDFWCKALQEKRLPADTDGTPMPGIPVFIVHTIPRRAGQARDGKARPEAAFDKFNHLARNRELQRILGPLKSHGPGSHRRRSKPPEDLYLSLSRFVKVPHRDGMDELLCRDKHEEDGPLDFARALFGQVPSEKLEPSEQHFNGPLKGRLFFGEAVLDRVPGEDEYEVRIGTTMSPRASFWPYYLRPSGARRDTASDIYDWSNEDARLAGWKRYPVRPGAEPVPFPWDDRPDMMWEERAKDPTCAAPTEAKMSFLVPRPGRPLVFTGEIRFHNLKAAELGALLWAITWGAADGRDGASVPQRHLIGRGKPMGYGRCVARVTKLAIERNDGGPAETASAYAASFRGWVETAYAEKTPEAGGTAFADLPMVKPLLAVADPRVAAGLEDRLAYPRHPFTPQARRDVALKGPKPPAVERTASLEGYVAVKKAARAAATAGEPPVTLPPYPTEPES